MTIISYISWNKSLWISEQSVILDTFYTFDYFGLLFFIQQRISNVYMDKN